MRPGYNPKNKLKPQTQIPKGVTFTKLPSKLQSFKRRLLSGSGFVVYK